MTGEAVRPPLAVAQQITASNYKAIGKNSLVASVDIETASGYIFRGVLFHRRDGKRWVQVPSREYPKQDGTRGFVPVVEFVTTEKWQAFNAACLAAIDKLVASVPLEPGGAA
jgi:hypothetical protein